MKFLVMFLVFSLGQSFAQKPLSCSEVLKFSNYYEKLRKSNDSDRYLAKSELEFQLQNVFELKARRGSFVLAEKSVPGWLKNKLIQEEEKLYSLQSVHEQELCKDFVPECVHLFAYSKSSSYRLKKMPLKSIDKAIKLCRGMCPDTFKSLQTHTTKNGGVKTGILNSWFEKEYPSKIDRKYLAKWPVRFLERSLAKLKRTKYCPRKECVSKGGYVGVYPNAPECCEGLKLKAPPEGVYGSAGQCVDINDPGLEVFGSEADKNIQEKKSFPVLNILKIDKNK